jgi:pimeloyl-ACP methyl ester carboxylesterase
LRPQLRDVAARIPHLASQIVHGSFDPIPITGSREVAEILGADLIELPVGHCPHVEATDEFVRAVDGFLPKQ